MYLGITYLETAKLVILSKICITSIIKKRYNFAAEKAAIMRVKSRIPTELFQARAGSNNVQFKLNNDRRYETDYDVVGNDSVHLLFVRH